MRYFCFILAFMCTNLLPSQAQDSDSILYRRLRTNWVEDLKKIHHTEFSFVHNERSISLDEYLNMPEDSIGGSEIYWSAKPLPLYYTYSYGREPKREPEWKGNSIESQTQFYVSGGVPPKFKEGEDSLRNYLVARQNVPDSLYKGDCYNTSARVTVYCCVDEDGKIWNVRGDKIEVFFPVICTIDIGGQFKNPVGRLTNSGAFSENFGKLLSCIAQDALGIVKSMPDFEPGRCFLKPVKYRIPIQISYQRSGQVVINYGL